jgi:ribose transport system permease protein
MSADVAAPPTTTLDEHLPLSERLRTALSSIDQGLLIGAVTAAMVVVGAIFVDGMLTVDNFATMARLASPLVILAVASALVIMSKNVDLSVVAVVSIAGMATVQFWAGQGRGELTAILMVVAVALVVGLLNGWLVAYAEIPALFVTLGTWKLFEGLFNAFLLDRQSYSLPADSTYIGWLGREEVLGVSMPTILAVVVVAAAWGAMRYTAWGQVLRATGDSPAAARLSGIPVRSLVMSVFVVAALLAALVGFLQLGINGGYSKAYGAGEELMFNAITAAVIGGVSLTGGKGSIFGVIAGTAFITVFVNMMTLLDVSVVTSAVIRGAILLAALALDAWLHPRDEETAKSDDL